MDKIKQAAIIMLGMGDKYASEILKSLNPEEVQQIIEAINQIGSVTEADVIKALNSFFKATNNNSGIDIVSKELFKNSLVSAVESKKIETFSDGVNTELSRWVDVFKVQSADVIASIVQDEHPQVIAMIASIVLTSETASKLIKRLPKELKANIVGRMANMGAVSTFSMEALSIFFEHELKSKDKYHDIPVDGVEAIANILSYLDAESEADIISGLSSNNAELAEKIQERVLPFERLAQLDKRSLQTLIAEVENDDMVMALKGADNHVKKIFLSNMSSKSADIINDEIDSKGPVKISNVIEAQKRIVNIAKKLASEDKIVISTKVDSDIIF